jgi:hypothetical protein
MAKKLQHKDIVKQDTEETRIKHLHRFYHIKRTKGKFVKNDAITIDKMKVVEIMMEEGFYRLDNEMNAMDYRFVHAKNKTLKVVDENNIIDFFLKQYVKNLPDYKLIWVTDAEDTSDQEETNTEKEYTITANDILSKLYGSLSNYFNKQLLCRLSPDIPIRFESDTKDSKNFYYQNCFCRVTKKGITEHEYSELENYIWADQVLPRNYISGITGKSIFEQFLEKVCSQLNTETGSWEFNPTRLISLRTIIGYSLHFYFNTKLKALILTDSRIATGNENNGRTGKTLLGKALGHMVKTNQQSKVYVEIDGKVFFGDDKHKYGDCSINTQLIHINDVLTELTLDNLYTAITDGVTVDQKNRQPFRIWTKILVSSNRSILIEGDSSKDRVIIFELSEYWNAKRSPDKEFGCWFFTDWDQYEWARFDKFMMDSMAIYLDKGLIEAPSINYQVNQIISHTNEDFYYWMTSNLVVGEQRSKRELYNNFREQYRNNDGTFTQFPKLQQRTFTNWMERYGKILGYIVHTERSPDTIGFYDEKHPVPIKKKDKPKQEDFAPAQTNLFNN